MAAAACKGPFASGEGQGLHTAADWDTSQQKHDCITQHLVCNHLQPCANKFGYLCRTRPSTNQAAQVRSLACMSPAESACLMVGPCVPCSQMLTLCWSA